MGDEGIDVFRFMALRDSEKLTPPDARKKFIRDDIYIYVDKPSPMALSAPTTQNNMLPTGVHDADLFSNNSLSQVGKNILGGIKGNLSKTQLIEKVEGLLVNGFQYTGFNGSNKLPPVVKEVRLDKSISPLQASMAGMLNQKPYYAAGNVVRILPDQLSDIENPLKEHLVSTLGYFNNFQRHYKSQTNPTFHLKKFIGSLADNIGLTKNGFEITELVFNVAHGVYQPAFLFSKRVLFDALYGLYILRKREKVSLEPAMQGLQALHLLEMIAITQYLMTLDSGGNTTINPNHPGRLKEVLETIYTGLKYWTPAQSDSADYLRGCGLPFPKDFAQLESLFNVVPIINPVIARLTTNVQPFNSITPVGLGDLKVVKQKFLGYRKGELAHVETVLASETKTRVHRSLEKTQDSFSFLSSSESENTKDTQSTSRFELKNETENVIKESINVNANLSAGYNYNNGMVVVNASAGMSYANSKDTTAKSSRNYVDEVVSKATSRIVSRASTERSRTLQVETEETNTHSFINTAPDSDHISGMYRWLDKVYQGQIYNYGKRLMFELVVPEPAAFYVQSRLYAYAASLDLPNYPVGTGSSALGKPPLPVQGPSEINEVVYDALKTKYKISNLPPPALTVDTVPVFHDNNASSLFIAQHPSQPGQIWDGYNNSSIRTGIITNYQLVSCRVTGSLDFHNADNRGGAPQNEKNTLEVQLNQIPVFTWMNDSIMGFHSFDEHYDLIQAMDAPENFRIDIGTQTNKTYSLNIYFNYALKPAVYSAWQQNIFDAINKPENLIIDPNSTLQPLPDPKLQTYEDALSKISAPQLNEIITGRSPADNELIVRKEIKRECISMITKEFDSIDTDDVISKKNAMGKLNVPSSIFFPNFSIHRGNDADKNTTTYAKYTDKNEGPQQYDVPNIDMALDKGRYIQFIEQAFEWEHLSQIFYPYFWADVPKWVELMSREDPSDPLFTSFLQAGSARVLLAVRPGYEGAVAHFLATREIWAGGPSPVIGDSLYVPLYDEIRSQQDSLSGATPDGEPWTFVLPTNLVYLESEKYKLVNEYAEPTQP